jgi:hypothetical protein
VCGWREGALTWTCCSRITSHPVTSFLTKQNKIYNNEQAHFSSSPVPRDRFPFLYFLSVDRGNEMLALAWWLLKAAGTKLCKWHFVIRYICMYVRSSLVYLVIIISHHGPQNITAKYIQVRILDGHKIATILLYTSFELIRNKKYIGARSIGYYTRILSLNCVSLVNIVFT